MVGAVSAALVGFFRCILAPLRVGVCRSAPRCRGAGMPAVCGCLTNRRRPCACAPPFPASLADLSMHRYRTHTCGALRESDIDAEARLSGWCHRIRDHGGVLFIDLRDHYGLTQVVADPDSPAFKEAETLRSEWVVCIDGKVRRRPDGTDNPDLTISAIESIISKIEVIRQAAEQA